jgi:simple sugar transport system permease protein
MNLDLLTTTFVVGWLAASVRLATPILLAALGETFTERGGVLNLGLEGVMLMGALSGFVGAFATGNLWAGILAALITGVLFGLLMGFFSVTAKVNQVVAGLGITILGSGLSTLLFRLFFGLRTIPPTIEMFPERPIPLLSDIPILGPVLFQHNILVYITFFLVLIAQFVLFRTRFGLALRSVGERPDAADTRGISVSRMRYTGLIIGGALAAVGGAYLPLANLGLFWTQMTAGRGFIAIAIVIFSRWNPVRGMWGALFFGATMALQLSLQTLRIPIASELLLMLPYIVTIIALVVVSRRAEFPGAFATPYTRSGE